MRKIHLMSLSPNKWPDYFNIPGIPDYRYAQIRNWVFKNLAVDFEDMLNLPDVLIGELKSKFSLYALKETKRQVSKDGTVKWALETHDNNFIECVMIPDGKRRSICISSQVGCAMGCKFCSTARMGFKRNLNLEEILEQLRIAGRYLRDQENKKITNVIFMGMGEPLNNFENVAEACKIIGDSEGFGISKRKITVSTAGIVPKILKWAEEMPEYKLAVSLNGSNDTMRSDLMPVNRKYSLGKLLKSLDSYVDITKQRLTFEYVLIDGKTCTEKAAGELKQIAKKHPCRINLIPLNEAENINYKSPSESQILEFKRILSDKSFVLLMRTPRGKDISAACGQLVQQQKKVA